MMPVRYRAYTNRLLPSTRAAALFGTVAFACDQRLVFTHKCGQTFDVFLIWTSELNHFRSAQDKWWKIDTKYYSHKVEDQKKEEKKMTTKNVKNIQNEKKMWAEHAGYTILRAHIVDVTMAETCVIIEWHLKWRTLQCGKQRFRVNTSRIRLIFHSNSTCRNSIHIHFRCLLSSSDHN